MKKYLLMTREEQRSQLGQTKIRSKCFEEANVKYVGSIITNENSIYGYMIGREAELSVQIIARPIVHIRDVMNVNKGGLCRRRTFRG